MEAIHVSKPYMIEPVVHHNSDGPNSNGSSSHSSQDEDGFNRSIMDRNWEPGLGIIFILYFTFSIKYFILSISNIYIFVRLIVIWFPTRCQCVTSMSTPIPK